MIEVIRTDGPDPTLDDLAAGVGMTKPVLYDEFGSRLGIADAIAKHLTSQLENGVATRLSAAQPFGTDLFIYTITDAFLALVVDDAELYEFIVRAYTNDGRGLLNNPIVQVLHDHVEPLVRSMSNVGGEELRILIDGLYGFVLAAIESWKAQPQLSRETIVVMITSILHQALVTVASDTPPPPGL